jgi:hypothetical protein
MSVVEEPLERLLKIAYAGCQTTGFCCVQLGFGVTERAACRPRNLFLPQSGDDAPAECAAHGQRGRE